MSNGTPLRDFPAPGPIKRAIIKHLCIRFVGELDGFRSEQLTLPCGA
ncbi:hypothetical protein [Aneurinibacillus terranovensis]